MKLQSEDIIKYIEAPQSEDVINKSADLSKSLNIHINGIGVDEYLTQVNNFESEEQFKVRKEITISQKYVFHSIVRIINKIFTAKGGSNYYQLGEKAKDKDLELELISKLKDIKGVPLRKWIQNKGLNKYLVDPNGIFLIEHKLVDGQKLCYPTYKSVSSIHDYKLNGREIDYVIFRLEQQEVDGVVKQIYRLYDDEKDLFFTISNNEVEILESYPNPWGKVPGVVIGDFYHNEFNIFDSRFSIGIELAKKRLNTESVKAAYEYYHGFPLTWQLLFKKCIPCNGSGYIKGKVCTSCHGSGYDLNKDVSKILGIIPPQSSDDPKLTPDVGGYIQPDIETWQEQRKELDWLEKKLQYTLLGSYIQEKADRETAVSRFIDVQPVNDTLNDFADWVENTEKPLTDFMAKYYYNNYIGCSINLGRRYMIEGPDELWEKYEKARKAGAPTEKLDDDITEYYEAKYANDAKTLQIQKKLFFVNDYRHLTIAEAKQNLPWEEFLRRLLYDSWKLTVSDDLIASTPTESLKKLFDTYIIKRSKTIKNETEDLSRVGSGKNL